METPLSCGHVPRAVCKDFWEESGSEALSLTGHICSIKNHWGHLSSESKVRQPTDHKGNSTGKPVATPPWASRAREAAYPTLGFVLFPPSLPWGLNVVAAVKNVWASDLNLALRDTHLWPPASNSAHCSLFPKLRKRYDKKKVSSDQPPVIFLRPLSTKKYSEHLRHTQALLHALGVQLWLKG